MPSLVAHKPEIYRPDAYPNVPYCIGLMALRQIYVSDFCSTSNKAFSLLHTSEWVSESHADLACMRFARSLQEVAAQCDDQQGVTVIHVRFQ